MQRHHRALAEADESERCRRQRVAFELGVEKALEPRCGLVDPDPALVRIAEGQAEPLPADRGLRARLRCVRRDERRLRQELLPGAADFDEIVAVSAIAVQKHDELSRGSRPRCEPRTIKLSGHSCLACPSCLFPARAARLPAL